jgi:hypothetical protein
MPGSPPPSKRAFRIASREPEALARHFSEAQQPDRALGYWLAAGERAIRRSANQEAIGHLTAGLAQLAQLRDTADRTKQELALQRLLGQANFHVKGLGALETNRAFSRARELCAVIDDDPSIIPVLFGIIIVEWGAGQLAKAEATANEILHRAGRAGDTGAGIAGDFAVAATSLQSGDLPRARRHFATALSHPIGASTWPRRIASPTTIVSSWGLFLTSMPAGAGGCSAIPTKPWISARNLSRSANASDTTILARGYSIVRALSTHFGANGRSLKNAPLHRSPSRESVDSA